MPLFEYACENCRKVHEVMQKFSDAPPASCPSCGGPVKKLVSAPAIQFKGQGWYVTDYAGKTGAAGGSTKNEGASEASSSESKPAETKPTTDAAPKADKPS